MVGASVAVLLHGPRYWRLTSSSCAEKFELGVHAPAVGTGLRSLACSAQRKQVLLQLQKHIYYRQLGWSTQVA